jgi:hypothetical protein
MNIRIDARAAALLERVARERGLSKSEVLRQALATLHDRRPRHTAVAPSVAVAHLIGSGDSGGMQLSKRTGERFARLLQENRKRRRGPGRRAD